jgi:hypothetical protein
MSFAELKKYRSCPSSPWTGLRNSSFQKVDPFFR